MVDDVFARKKGFNGKQVESIEYMMPEMVPETPLGKNFIDEINAL